MGFNNYYVNLNVTSSTINNYEKLGYIIPKKINYKGNEVYDTSKTIDIYVYDLVSGSNANLDYSCDNCGKKVNVTWRRYLKYNIDGNYYCRECKHENPKFIKRIKKKEKKSKSRSCFENSLFIRTVLKRDNYRCQCCGVKANKNNLEIHHLNGYHWCVEGRYDPSNGITLCNENANGCHNNFHSIYGKLYNTKEQFEEWIGYRLENLKNYEKIEPFSSVYCIEDNIIYESIYKCAEEIKCSASYVYQMCHGNRYSYKKKHYIYYKDYLNMSSYEIDELLLPVHNDKFKVINPEFGNLFLNAKIADEKYSAKNIAYCCNGKRNYSGKYKGIKLTWIRYDDYMNFSIDEKLSFIKKNLETLEKGSFLMQEYNNLK